ncbi:Cytochrome c oxidase assembly protein cox19 [Tilletia horrida]|uniref:Cytochrome c oxidase assembly protein cox19 n=1 Tax=Tilletia horrida TaxID=155126 RepID=A0AAN6GEF7_9BASI|nr:Cytochrome c oxidase assembly protein cox19 [Tilletia horrida]KAK0540966.1 Cytochrome c oxidase assembly protein cox19 [Tilletia horrida]KAK0565901.1 Cytochrome c oxidase assembly protein cox19 [Tilletia horrida]
MSFGRPPSFGSLTNVTLAPPEYGSFPIDHDGECKDAMKQYMACLKAHKNDNGQCRALSKQYLECRMAKGLMEKHDLGDLGFKDIVAQSAAPASPPPSSSSPSTSPSSSAQNQRMV